MRKTLLISIFICVLASSAWSYTVGGGIDVGNLDTLIGSIDKPGLASYGSGNGNGTGEIAELNWATSTIRSWLGNPEYDVHWSARYDTPQDPNDVYPDWVETTTPGIWAIDFMSNDPAFFFIKTGALIPGNGDSQYHFLFANNGSLDYGVINLLSQFDGSTITGIGKISHVGEFNAAPVPVPAAIILLGSGLLGLAGFRKKMKK